MTKQIAELDGLRGWMALWVWWAHVSSLAVLPIDNEHGPGWMIANGEFAVGVFVILSGFVISMTLDDAGAQAKRVFYLRRAFRLFPAYLICLVISAFVLLDPSITTLETLPWPSPHTAGRLTYLNDSRDAFWTHLALHVPLFHGIIPQSLLRSTSYAFMGQAWSLTLEWQYYLIAPFVFACMSWFEWTPLRQAALLLVLGLLARRFTQSSMLPSNLYMFTIGYFSFKLYQRRDARRLSNLSFLTHIAIWGLAALLVNDRWISLLIWAPVLYGICRQSPPLPVLCVKQFLSLRPSTRLGAISYSFYCSHMIAVFGCAYVLLVLLEIRDKLIYSTALVITSLVVTLLLSTLLHEFVEKPCIAVGRRWGRALETRELEVSA